MKKYSVGRVRERFAQALDEADRGQPVFIERRGVLYRLAVEPPATARKKPVRPPYIDVLDPAIAAGAWTLDWRPDGIRFTRRRRQR